MQHMISARERETVRITKEKDHGTKVDAEQGKGEDRGTGWLWRLILLLTGEASGGGG